jgi:hypothetical protein
MWMVFSYVQSELFRNDDLEMQYNCVNLIVYK